ncbi:MAG TPA: TonB-dependent siderophore receptor [Candidatus Sulfotelmatobacter sp.]|jgi:iron complex outermembrane receptor protein|nr:TonB-dependent siderophore receptor [Candidatus Sulfotelmatobacter sp.]
MKSEKTLRALRKVRLFGGVALTAICIAASPARAADADGKPAAESAQVNFAIPAQSLSGALTLFGRQAGIQISVNPALVNGLSSDGLNGRMGVAAGLSRLLVNSGLTFQFTEPGTAVLTKAAAEGATTLSPVNVESSGAGAAADTARGPTTGYVATHSASATKTDTPISETSQSVSVVTREQLDEQNAKTVTQALRYTPGAFTGQVGASNRYDNVILRGMVERSITNIYLDGLKLLNDDHTYSAMQVDPYFLERIDVVKGPSSVLYGSGTPGGVIDLTSKRPLFEPSAEIEVSMGNRSQRSTSFDISGPADDSGNLAYRLVGTGHTAKTEFSGGGTEERYAIAPSLTAKTDDTTLTILTSFQKDPNTGTHGAVPGEGTLTPHNGQYLSRKFFDGEPDKDGLSRDQNMAGYELEHRFNDSLTARQNVRYLNSSVDFSQYYGYGWSGTSNDLTRYYIGGTEHMQAVNVDNQLEGDFSTGPVVHKLLGGLDYQGRSTKYDWLRGTATTIDAFNPVYGNTTLTGTSWQRHTLGLEQTGLYLQDQIALDHWRISLGARQDWANTSDENRLTNDKTEEQRHKLTKRGGLLYAFDNGVSPYVSYSESFNPSLYTDASGNALKPTEAHQYEGGVKFQPPGSRSMVSAALFTIDQENTAMEDITTGTYKPVGTIRSQGVELEGNLQVTDELRVMAGYSLTDAKYQSTPYGNEGHGVVQVPKNMASLWADYSFAKGPLRYLSLGAGVHYVGESWADIENTTKVPSYTIFDASLRYDLEAVGAHGAEFRLNATNLFDKSYIASCYNTTWCYWGEERTITGTLSYKF